MAGLEGLASIIYHEKQQSGSMLCAQHALNSLLQENYFTAPDLSDIARNLDRLEEQYDTTNAGNTSHNMDDTGFFSVQVLENAVRVLGLGLTRWRGEEMRPYQDHPHTQLAFILNLEQHWFTLRRFGHALSNLDDDPGDGHWFNLNSSLHAPEWVGKLYLGMVLQQAEADGYSVFAVTQTDPTGPLALHRTEADEVASTLPEPRGASHLSTQSISTPFTSNLPSSSAPAPDPASGFEDEDYDLQAALQASLASPRPVPLTPPRIARAFAPLPPSDPDTPLPPYPGTGAQTPTYEPLVYPVSDPRPADLDPVAASMERNRRMLQRMRAEQEYAQRELAENSDDVAVMETRRRERQREEDEEAEQLRRAIEESEALARVEGHARDRNYEDDDDDDDDFMDVEVPVPQTTRPNLRSTMGDRVYDDDDAELQAALKASLEHVPEGWELPELTHRTPVLPSALPADDQNTRIHREPDKEEAESVLSDDTGTSVGDNMSSNPSEEDVSVDELRRRRLARFGA